MGPSSSETVPPGASAVSGMLTGSPGAPGMSALTADSPGAAVGPAAGERSSVRRRQVFYIAGFDPQGPSHYHRLHAEEAPRQARVAGYAMNVGPRRRVSDIASGWRVDGEFEDGAAAVASQLEFLRWDDIVRAHWPRARWRVMLGALASTIHQVRNGVLWRVLKTSWPAFVVLALPPALVALLLAWAGVTVVACAALLSRGWALPAVVAAGTSGLAWWGFAAWAEAKVQMAWLMRSTRFILRQARGDAPDLERRLDQCAERIAQACREPEWDEVLVVGHSSGAMLAVSAVARTLSRLDAAGASAARPALLTLGECIPMLSYQPEAAAFRQELAALATAGDLTWIDVTAPPDGCCFALVDPTAAARAGHPHPSAAWRSPKLLSARFAQMFSPAAYARLRRDRHRCHFQYLQAAERVTDYDYFAITGGPIRLRDRFASHRSVDNFRQFQLFGGPSR